MTEAAVANPQASVPYSNDADRWAAVERRDREADGQFYYSVETTGVYCRPSCGARLALRQNVRFHSTCEAAERNGFRPCKRCRPNSPGLFEQRTAAIEEACRTLAAADESPNLEDIAEAAGMSRFHFQRVFKEVTGVTPRAYFAECRKQKVQNGLTRSKTVTDAIYEAGFNSNSRFYADATQMLGMWPKTFRSGGYRTCIRFAVGECSLGSILIAATDKGLCSILLGEDPEKLVQDLQRRFPGAEFVGGDRAFEEQIATVVGFVENPRHGLGLALDIRGTAFQQRVWRALQEIPPGSTRSYEEIAARIGRPESVRAVAGACAANALAIAIPCHRVVRKDGNLSGYRWGVERKRTLLDREAAL